MVYVSLNMKICTKCKVNKPLTDYHNKINTGDGKACRCKPCNQSKPKSKERAILDSKNWALRHPEKKKKIFDKWYKENKHITRIRSESTKEKNKTWFNANRDRINELRRIRKRNPTPKQIISKILRDRFNKVIIRMKSGTKHTSCMNLVGCDFDTLKSHIESQFKDGMNWSNHGNGDNKWNIDHIKPLVTFDLHSLEQQQVAFHYFNLRPLWFSENMKRSRKHWQLSA